MIISQQILLPITLYGEHVFDATRDGKTDSNDTLFEICKNYYGTETDCECKWVCGSRIDYSCNVDSDCEIKNVGNLCGYYPQCVNKDFIPNPPELDSVVCGFPAIDSCKCVENKCKGTIEGKLVS